MKSTEEWNLTDIFKTKKDYEEEKERLYVLLKQIQEKQGTIIENSNNLYTTYQIYEKALESYSKLYAYAMLQYHLDMANQESIKQYKEAEKIGADFSQAVSYIVPEITQIDEKTLQKYVEEEKGLEMYNRDLEEIMERKKHTLSKEEENLLATYAEIFSNAENTYDTFTNAEMKFGNILNEEGKEEGLTEANYTVFLRSQKQSVRKEAFNRIYETYAKFRNTITELYLARVKQDTITSKIRKYQSSLEKAVIQDDASMQVYNSLIEAVQEGLQVNHEFMKMKKELLHLSDMHLYDIYLNPFEEEKDEISYEEAKKEILEALKVLGEAYQEKLKEAFENQWIDVYEKENKRNGAYSMGVYGVHPFVLTNFVHSKRDVSTIAHELGHSMHSYYASSSQNIINADYTILVAEVASTVNEILLASYQIEKENNTKKKAILLYELLEMIRATFYRQTMFAQFEKQVHEEVEKGTMLSADDLCNKYYKLNQIYFGKEVEVDKQIQYEWERIPHFYTPFYVYKYAVGISCAITIAMNILNKKPGYQEKYIEMLKQGRAKKSIDLLKMVDIDIESKVPYENTVMFFKEKMKELQECIKK